MRIWFAVTCDLERSTTKTTRIYNSMGLCKRFFKWVNPSSEVPSFALLFGGLTICLTKEKSMKHSQIDIMRRSMATLTMKVFKHKMPLAQDTKSASFSQASCGQLGACLLTVKIHLQFCTKNQTVWEQRLRLSSFTLGSFSPMQIYQHEHGKMDWFQYINQYHFHIFGRAELNFRTGVEAQMSLVTLHKCTDQSGITDLVHLQLTLLHLLKVPEKERKVLLGQFWRGPYISPKYLHCLCVAKSSSRQDGPKDESNPQPLVFKKAT